jgi:flagellar motor protein MotB
MSTLRHTASRPGDEDSYLASVSDLMVGLLFVFIIMLMAFALNFRTAEERTATTGSELAEAREEAERTRARLAAEIDNLEAEQRLLRSALAAQQAELESELVAILAQRDRLAELAQGVADRELTRAGMLQQVQDLLARRQVAVAIEPENGVLRLPEELLFDSGAAVPREEGERALRALAYALARSLPCYAQAPAVTQRDCPKGATPILEAVLIEGHTDDRPITAAPFKDNWNLASLRGINTYKALVRFEPSLELLRNHRGEPLLGVSAYEARRPVVDEPTDAARRLNRRIDLRFVVAAPSSAELTRVRSSVVGPSP